MAFGVGLFEAAIRFVVKDRKAIAQMRQMETQTQKVGKAFKATRDQFADMAGSFTLLAVGSRILKGMAQWVKMTAEIELGFKKLQAMSGATGKAMDHFRAGIMRAAELTSYNVAQATEAMTTLFRATGDLKSSMSALTPVLNVAMASMGKLSPEMSAKMLASVHKGFGFSGERLGTAAAQILSGALAAGVAVEELSQVQGKLALAAQSAGQTFEDVLASYLLVRRVGYSSQRSATQMMRMFDQLSSVKVRDSLETRFIRLIDNYGTGSIKKIRAILGAMMGQMGGKAQENIMRDVMSAGSGLSTTSQKALKSLLISMRKGVMTPGGRRTGLGAFDYIMEQLDPGIAKGKLKEFGDTYQKTMAATLQRLSESLSNLAVTVGKLLLPALRPLADMLGVVVGVIRKFVNELGDTGKFIIKTSIVAGALGATLWAAQAAFHGFAGILRIVQTNLYGNAAAATMASRGLATLGMSAKGASRGVLMLGRATAAFMSILKVAGLVLLIEGLHDLRELAKDKETQELFQELGDVMLATIPGATQAVDGLVASMREYVKVHQDMFGKDALARTAGGIIGMRKWAEGQTGGITGFFLGAGRAALLDPLKQAEKVMLDAVSKRGKKLEGAAKNVHKYLQLGTKELNRLINRVDKMSVMPTRVKLPLVAALEKRLMAQGRLGGREGRLGKAGLAEMMQARKTIERSIAGEDVSPAEKAKAYLHLKRGLIAYTEYAPHARGAAFAKRFGEGVLDPTKATFSEANIARSMQIAHMLGGKVPIGLAGEAEVGMAPEMMASPLQQAMGVQTDQLTKMNSISKQVLEQNKNQTALLRKLAGEKPPEEKPPGPNPQIGTFNLEQFAPWK